MTAAVNFFDFFRPDLSWRRSWPDYGGINCLQKENDMQDTPSTTVVVAKPEKSVPAALVLTFLFGPLGLLYALSLIHI